MQKNIVLLGMTLSILCLIAASFQYPGGSPGDSHSLGFHWTENYISDMLDYKAVNGAENSARPLAMLGVILMGLSTGLAFIRFARKVGVKKYSLVIQYGGALVVLLAAMNIVPAWHDLAVLISITLNLLIFFYITIVLFKSPFAVFKVLAVVFLTAFYVATFMYSTRSGLEYMPLVQKITHIIQIAWILGLEYFTRKEDFAHLN